FSCCSATATSAGGRSSPSRGRGRAGT
ncbi:MAG: hypothetical protein AVDCRST_MAG69-1998, partial [uncultured Solirubrobacteraceae bacterium]